MTLIVGDYVKIKNHKFHSGEIGKLEGYDGVIYYRVKLSKTGKVIECVREEFVKIDDPSEIQKSFYSHRITEGVVLTIKNRNLKYKCDMLEANPFLYGLYALGKYYSKSNYPKLHKNSYLTQLILKLKNFDEESAKLISKILIQYISNYPDLKSFIAKIDYTIVMPTANPYNHAAVWGNLLTDHLHKQDISNIIIINPSRKTDLKYYKYKNPYIKNKIMEDAFVFQGEAEQITDKNVLILDDVCTTGNQINAMTNLLVENGVSKVISLVIGRTKNPYMN